MALDVCICEITVSMDLVMGSGYFQVFVYKLASVPVWVSSSVSLGILRL